MFWLVLEGVGLPLKEAIAIVMCGGLSEELLRHVREDGRCGTSV